VLRPGGASVDRASGPSICVVPAAAYSRVHIAARSSRDDRKAATPGMPESTRRRGRPKLLAIAGTGYGLIGILVIILLIVLIFYFLRRA
jgi:hypothetical protein